MIQLQAIHVQPLTVPLREPFVIASATMTSTRAALVRAVASSNTEGLGEAATLPPVTREDLPDVLGLIERTAHAVCEKPYAALTDVEERLASIFADAPVAKAGVEMAIVDAWARDSGVPVHALLGAPAEVDATWVTDITLPILAREEMVRLAGMWKSRGFSCFKVKVGKDLEADIDALRSIASFVTDATFRIDANGGFTAEEALKLLRRADSLVIECFEQPCAREDLDGMAKLVREAGVPIVADESVRSLDDLEAVLRVQAAHGVNLKLAKMGGMLAALGIGRRARSHGLRIMMGGMVETRLGMTAAGHVAAALGGVDYVDLDTAWLLSDDPFEGGYVANGPKMRLLGEGLGITMRA